MPNATESHESAHIEAGTTALGDELIALGRYCRAESDVEPAWLPAMPAAVMRAVAFQRAAAVHARAKIALPDGTIEATETVASQKVDTE